MEFWVQLVINSLVLGLTYVLIASGLSLVLGINRILNFAHGEFYMLAGFSVYWISTVLGVNYFITLLITIIILGALGWVVQRGLYQFVQASLLRTVIVSIGLMLSIPALAQLAFSEKTRVVGTVIPGSVHLFGIPVTLERLMIILISILIMLGLWYVVQRTKFGLMMRVVAEDREAAMLQGINVNNANALSMFIGCGLAAVAGGVFAPLAWVSPFLGASILFKAFVVVILGGIGTISGAAAAGLLLGFAEVMGVAFVGGWIDVIPFVIVFLVLLFRPTGLLGRVKEF